VVTGNEDSITVSVVERISESICEDVVDLIDWAKKYLGKVLKSSRSFTDLIQLQIMGLKSMSSKLKTSG